jgi:RimJ/RimL family protein N-acetyltransferase
MVELKHLTRIDVKTWDANRIQWIWEHLQTQEYMFDDLTRGDPKFFLSMLFFPNTEHYEYGDDGYVLVNNIRPKIDAAIHYAIWDRTVPLRRTLEAGRSLLRYLFQTYDLHRVTGMIPSYHKPAIRMITLNGFRYEGSLRQGHLVNGKFYDIMIYGLLQPEFQKLEETWVSRPPLSLLQ